MTSPPSFSYLQPSFFDRLPTEHILMICQHLSHVDTACLALCCRASLFKIGTKSLSFSKIKPCDKRKQFLTRLSTQLPEYYLCHHCFKLHDWLSIPTPQGTRLSRRKYNLCFLKSRWISTQSLCYPFSIYCLQFEHVQLVMRRHRYGPESGISADQF